MGDSIGGVTNYQIPKSADLLALGEEKLSSEIHRIRSLQEGNIMRLQNLGSECIVFLSGEEVELLTYLQDGDEFTVELCSRLLPLFGLTLNIYSSPPSDVVLEEVPETLIENFFLQLAEMGINHPVEESGRALEEFFLTEIQEILLFRELKYNPNLTEEREREILSEVTKRNILLVMSRIGAKIGVHKDDYRELFQLGWLGLQRAVMKFDLQFGTRFSTYAVPWIDTYITRGSYQLHRTIKVPDNVLEKWGALKRAIDQIDQLENPPERYSDDWYLKIAKMLAFEPIQKCKTEADKRKYLIETARAYARSLIINNFVQYDPDYTIGSISDVDRNEIGQESNKVLGIIARIYREGSLRNKKLMMVLILRYGLFGSPEFTGQDVGMIVRKANGAPYTKQSISAMEDSALKLLRVAIGKEEREEFLRANKANKAWAASRNGSRK